MRRVRCFDVTIFSQADFGLGVMEIHLRRRPFVH